MIRKSQTIAVLLLSLLATTAVIAQNTPATMLSPTAGSTLSSSRVTFVWTPGTNVTAYRLHVGTTPHAHDIASVGTGAATSAIITNVPTLGAPVYVTLYSLIGKSYKSNVYSYTEYTGYPGTMTSPASGTALTSTSATFHWTSGTNVTDFRLRVGTTPGAYDIASIPAGTATSATVNNIPANGSAVYVTLYSDIGGYYQPKAYSYLEAPGIPAVITSPTSGSSLPGSNVIFTWNSGTNVTDYRLYVGSSPGGSDIASISTGTNTSATVSNIPTCGDPVYVTLYSNIAGAYQSNAASYSEFNDPLATLSSNPSSLNLGSIMVGSSGTASGKLVTTCQGVTVSAATTTESGVFSVGGISLPLSIPAHSSAPYSITFSPQTTGTTTATLSITSNAQVSSANASLAGNGTQAPTHSVNLSWQGSTSSGVVGYNLYRAPYTTSCGSYSKINPTLDTSTTYSDNTVTAGTSYCYAATAVNSQNSESAYSNVDSNVQIPTP